jgi:hypothetical protein
LATRNWPRCLGICPPAKSDFANRTPLRAINSVGYGVVILFRVPMNPRASHGFAQGYLVRMGIPFRLGNACWNPRPRCLSQSFWREVAAKEIHPSEPRGALVNHLLKAKAGYANLEPRVLETLLLALSLPGPRTQDQDPLGSFFRRIFPRPRTLPDHQSCGNTFRGRSCLHEVTGPHTVF